VIRDDNKKFFFITEPELISKIVTLANGKHAGTVSKAEYLDTLGQMRTNGSKELTATVTGKGTDLSDKKLPYNKAKKKTITQEMTLGIIAHRANEGAPKMEIQRLWNTYHCQWRIDNR
jgi:hypothetical protein